MLALAGLMLASCGKALAGPAECASIANAFGALAEIPGFAESVDVPGQPPAQLIVIGNSLYLRGASGWRSKTLPPGRRISYVLPDFSDSGLDHCETHGTEDLAGTMVRRYTFSLNTDKAPREVTLLVGLQDGLIRALETGGGRLTLRYDGLLAPIP